MNELNQKTSINQIVNKIYEEMSSEDPYFPRVVDYLRDLRTKEEYQSLTNSEFYDIVGKTFKINPVIFMTYIYSDRRFYQYNRIEMQKYILKKFSLYEGEQILFEGSGKIIQESGWGINTVSGRIYVTNDRIIAQGTLSTTKPTQDRYSLTWSPKMRKSRDELIEGSTNQELPCYGYQFNITVLRKLKKKKKDIRYSDSSSRKIKITLTYTKEALSLKLNRLYDILLLRKNINHPLMTIRTELAKEYPSKLVLVPFLKDVLVSEDYKQITDVEYLDIVRETYKLNPEFFKKSIFPKLIYWKSSSFLKIKNELIEILNEEGANIQ